MPQSVIQVEARSVMFTVYEMQCMYEVYEMQCMYEVYEMQCIMKYMKCNAVYEIGMHV